MPRKAKADSTSSRQEQRAHSEAVHIVNDKIEKLQTTPPRHLNGTASRLWSTLVPALNKSGLVTSIDRTSLESYCIAYQLMRKAYDDIKENGATYTTSTGRTYKNPSIDILSDNMSKMKSIGAELGLSPQSRSNLVDIAMDDGSENFKDIMMQFGGK